MKCATHPDVETGLTCGKCGKPICPKCMVQTPIGARCKECAGLDRLPTYRLSTSYLVRGAAAALVAAVVGGIAWGLLNMWMFFNLSLILGAFLGLGIAEAIGLVTNRKRGKGLIGIGVAGLLLGFTISLLTPLYLHGIPLGFIFHLSLYAVLFDLAGLGLGIYTLVLRLR